MRRIAVIIIVLVLTEMLFPAGEKIRFRHLSIKQGLSSSTVYCIFQDSKGFMWFGTMENVKGTGKKNHSLQVKKLV
jgi:ligand-binding sensor domain-containing protein